MTDLSREESPLDADVAALLGRERTDPAFAAGKARIARRLELSAIAVAAVSATAGSALPASPPGGAPLPAHAAGLRLLREVGIAALLVGVGGFVGARLQARHETSLVAPAAPAAVVAPAPAGAPIAPSSPAGSSVAESASLPTVDVDSLPRAVGTANPSASAHAPLASSSTVARGPTSTSLAEEQRLLDTARAAVGRGAYAAALVSLGDHESRFPSGRLVEERELLMVQALAGEGHEAEAKARAARFEARFPGSIFVPAVRQAWAIGSP